MAGRNFENVSWRVDYAAGELACHLDILSEPRNGLDGVALKETPQMELVF
jgi:hypothetical protein